jgi:hypothetical protein
MPMLSPPLGASLKLHRACVKFTDYFTQDIDACDPLRFNVGRIPD